MLAAARFFLLAFSATCMVRGARTPPAFALRVRQRLAAAVVTAATALSSGPGFVAVAATTPGTVQLDDPETVSLFKKAQSEESDGQFADALRDYQQVVQVAPTYIIGWANLGNVLTAQGNLNDALLCYKKAISLYPPADTLATILLNKASIEMSTGAGAEAIKDLQAAELLAGPKPEILSNKAVALTNEGRWGDALQIFEKIVSSAERNALPWWLRYSMALLEQGRGVEAVAYYQRTLKSFPREAEIKAFGAALYTANNAPLEARNFWKELSDEDRAAYSDAAFREKLKWGTVTTQNFERFLQRINRQ